eukprot:g6370.t1
MTRLDKMNAIRNNDTIAANGWIVQENPGGHPAPRYLRIVPGMKDPDAASLAQRRSSRGEVEKSNKYYEDTILMRGGYITMPRPLLCRECGTHWLANQVHRQLDTLAPDCTTYPIGGRNDGQKSNLNKVYSRIANPGTYYKNRVGRGKFARLEQEKFSSTLMAVKHQLLMLEARLRHPEALGDKWCEHENGVRRAWIEMINRCSIDSSSSNDGNEILDKVTRTCIDALLVLEKTVASQAYGDEDKNDVDGKVTDDESDFEEEEENIGVFAPRWFSLRKQWRQDLSRSGTLSNVSMLASRLESVIDWAKIGEVKSEMDRRDWTKLVKLYQRSFIPKIGDNVIFFADGYEEAAVKLDVMRTNFLKKLSRKSGSRNSKYQSTPAKSIMRSDPGIPKEGAFECRVESITFHKDAQINSLPEPYCRIVLRKTPVLRRGSRGSLTDGTYERGGSSLCVVNNRCFMCKGTGELIQCDVPSCGKVFKPSCLGLSEVPRGIWVCPLHRCSNCTKGIGGISDMTTKLSSLVRCKYCTYSLCGQCVIQKGIIMDQKNRVGLTGEFLGVCSKCNTSEEKCQRLMLEIWTTLSDSPDARMFAQPVNREMYPDYDSIVSEPMDLRTIRERIKAGYYYDSSKITPDHDDMTVAKKYDSNGGRGGRRLRNSPLAIHSTTSSPSIVDGKLKDDVENKTKESQNGFSKISLKKVYKGAFDRFVKDVKKIGKNCEVFCSDRWPAIVDLSDNLMNLLKRTIAARQNEIVALEENLDKLEMDRSENDIGMDDAEIVLTLDDHTKKEGVKENGGETSKGKKKRKRRGEKDTFVVMTTLLSRCRDYIVPVEDYQMAKNKKWEKGERFQLYFREDGASRGANYYGIVHGAKDILPNGLVPWKALAVKWEKEFVGFDGGRQIDYVNPWEVLKQNRPKKNASRKAEQAGLGNIYGTSHVNKKPRIA